MINNISLPKVSVSAPKKQMRINAEEQKAKMFPEKMSKELGIHWEPCLTTVPIFVGAKNMDEAVAAYKKMQSLL